MVLLTTTLGLRPVGAERGPPAGRWNRSASPASLPPQKQTCWQNNLVNGGGAVQRGQSEIHGGGPGRGGLHGQNTRGRVWLMVFHLLLCSSC